jgi:hypothetical protein
MGQHSTACGPYAANTYFCKSNFIGIEPQLLVCLGSVPAFALQRQRLIGVTESAYNLQSQKHLLSGPLKKKFVDPFSELRKTLSQ